jgi:hypothetical protein
MYEDRRLFLLGLDSWNLDFCSLYESFFRDMPFSELDLFDPVEAIRGDLERESLELREARLTLMPSGNLFRQLITVQALPSFLRELCIRSHEETRLILIFFFANMFRFCLFSRPTERCPMCLSNLNAPHFFDCPGVDRYLWSYRTPTSIMARFCWKARLGEFHWPDLFCRDVLGPKCTVDS